MIQYIQKKYQLSESGAKDLRKGIIYSVLANFSLMLPVGLLGIVIASLLPFITGQTGKLSGIWGYSLLGIGFLPIIFILHFIQYSCTYIGTYQESARRRITIAEQLRRLPLAFYGERDIADITAVIMGDCANFEHAFSHTVPQFWGAVISTGMVCLALLWMNWKLGLALLWVAPAAFAIVLLSKKLQDRLGKKHITAKNDLADGIQECLENIQEIRACNAQEDYLQKLEAKMDCAERTQISSEMVTASLITAGQMFLRLGMATVIVSGSTLVLGGNTDLFTYILFLIAASRIYDPLSGAMANMAELFSVQLQVQRMKEIIDYPLQQGDEKLTEKNYDITFDHVNFSYLEGKSILKDLSFTAKQGQVTALAGPSGGGKSTVVKLAARFYDIDAGHIYLGGQDISRIAPEELMKKFAFVFQDVVMFHNTIMENIRIGRHTASDQEVIAAAKAAQCDAFIRRLPYGYQTTVGENGSTLSGGERQRISIARALLKDAPVVLLDEATASLDVDSETQVQKAISKLIEGKTVIVIAHRMRTIEAADKILVLNEGRVQESGTHDELMAQGGFYQRLTKLQKKSVHWRLRRSKTV